MGSEHLLLKKRNLASSAFELVTFQSVH